MVTDGFLPENVARLGVHQSKLAKNERIITSSPWEQCMLDLDPSNEKTLLQGPPRFFPRGQRDANLTLKEAFLDNDTVVYLLHQRKAGGTTLRHFLSEEYHHLVGYDVAGNSSFVPCYFGVDCEIFEFPTLEQNYHGRNKLIAGHFNYHASLARAAFEKQVLITNFREPVARIKSCMLYRYFKPSKNLFGRSDFTMDMGVDLLMKSRDRFGSSCLQEPFRILSPFDPDLEPVPPERVDEICCWVKSQFHVVHTPARDVFTTTAIEKELNQALKSNVINKNNREKRMSQLGRENLAKFLEYIGKENAFVQSEQRLYNCLFPSQQAVPLESSTGALL